MMLVSIVIPVYNSSKYLSQCLDSLISQTYKNLEILCVNDGSTDNSLDILKEYEKKDNRIKVFTKENEGKGAASARNMGLANATGDYIFFLDSDDFFETDMISLVVDKIYETDADVVVFSANRYDDKLKCITGEYDKINIDIAPPKAYFSYVECKDVIYQIGDLTAWNKVFRRSLIIDNNLYFEEIPISDDQYVPALAVLYAKRISIIDRALVNYRYNTGVSQCDSASKHPEAAYQAVFSIVNKMREMQVYDSVKRSYLNMAMRIMREYFDKMDTIDNVEFLYMKYKNEIFPFLDALNLPANYFYDCRIGEWYRLIMDNSLEEILFKVARAYGCNMTTGILRFQVPYDKIDFGSRIVLVGKGIVGRYWYSQLLLSNYADVAQWVESVDEISVEYDEVIYA